MKTIDMETINFTKLNGLIPAVIQDASSSQVLMVGFMNREALEATVKSGKVTFYSRTKKRLWQKGETSGNTLSVISIVPDCDCDTVLIMAKAAGPACHTGEVSCFGPENQTAGISFLKTLFDLIAERKAQRPQDSYTTSLLDQGLSVILEKIAEESEEVLLAAESQTDDRLVEESADLLYHLFVLLVSKGISLDDIEKELKQRNETM